MNLARLKPATLRALYRIAKHPTKGVRPFFADPRRMIALRQEMENRDGREHQHR